MQSTTHKDDKTRHLELSLLDLEHMRELGECWLIAAELKIQCSASRESLIACSAK